VHYRNPRIVAGCIATWRDRVLLCRRSIDPCRGLWTLPAGYVELGETLEEAAVREAQEEAGAIVSGLRLFALYDLPHIGEVYALYLASLADPTWHAGPESIEVGLFHAGDIPWHALAFSTIREALTAWAVMDRNLPSPVFSADFRHAAKGALRVRYRRQQN
jgi:ADP-ribose pyrophosphatase YjhB (NUDIX family)